MHEMMDSQIWKLRREEVMRAVELNRQAKAVRPARTLRAGRTALLAWELKRGLATFSSS